MARSNARTLPGYDVGGPSFPRAAGRVKPHPDKPQIIFLDHHPKYKEKETSGSLCVFFPVTVLWSFLSSMAQV